MTKLQFYKSLAGVLLVLNLFMLGFFFFTKGNPPPRKHETKERIIKQMKMDEQQHQHFLMFFETHNKKIENFREQQRGLLETYFKNVIDSTQILDVDSILLQIQLLERKKVEATYGHFKDIKSVLRKDQYVYFEDFVNNRLKVMLRSRKPKK